MPRHQKLLTPLSFLRLRSPDLRFYQWYAPAFLTIGSLFGFYLLPSTPHLLTDKGLVNTINGLLTTLIGFYIAALAAIATFNNESLDEVMKGRPPIISVNRKGTTSEEVLTRRRFLVVLFGYCSFLSIMLFVFGVMTLLVAPSVGQSYWSTPLRFIWLIVYFAMASSLFIVTLLGLHYLIDRMHRE